MQLTMSEDLPDCIRSEILHNPPSQWVSKSPGPDRCSVTWLTQQELPRVHRRGVLVYNTV
jgi:hypothetical protein